MRAENSRRLLTISLCLMFCCGDLHGRPAHRVKRQFGYPSERSQGMQMGAVSNPYGTGALSFGNGLAGPPSIYNNVYPGANPLQPLPMQELIQPILQANGVQQQPQPYNSGSYSPSFSSSSQNGIPQQYPQVYPAGTGFNNNRNPTVFQGQTNPFGNPVSVYPLPVDQTLANQAYLGAQLPTPTAAIPTWQQPNYPTNQNMFVPPGSNFGLGGLANQATPASTARPALTTVLQTSLQESTTTVSPVTSEASIATALIASETTTPTPTTESTIVTESSATTGVTSLTDEAPELTTMTPGGVASSVSTVPTTLTSSVSTIPTTLASSVSTVPTTLAKATTVDPPTTSAGSLTTTSDRITTSDAATKAMTTSLGTSSRISSTAATVAGHPTTNLFSFVSSPRNFSSKATVTLTTKAPSPAPTIPLSFFPPTVAPTDSVDAAENELTPSTSTVQPSRSTTFHSARHELGKLLPVPRNMKALRELKHGKRS
ncbi:hypothetical protein BV898_15860 [Hypsibius exemplaris]|uniref:Uncharacterized protein n=1 Tax=Hypsibius exemplaris TaxID=2072580 RepID=A0A9X6NC01_HYPEX|nr:hypothetical protein BV898_15860 [Hypsibius exemplaris]